MKEEDNASRASGANTNSASLDEKIYFDLRRVHEVNIKTCWLHLPYDVGLFD